MKKIFLALILTLIFPSIVSAECSNKDVNRLRTIGNNVDVTYDYYYVGDKVKFRVTITNLHKDIYVHNRNDLTELYYGKDSKNPSIIVVDGFNPGKKYEFKVYGNTDNCKDKYIATKYVTLPMYNSYSTDKLCDGIEDFYLCKKWANVSLSYKEFVKRIEEYKNKNEIIIDDEEEVIKDLKYYIDYIIKLLLKYNTYYIIALILVLVLIYIIKQNDNFKIE